MLKKKKIIRLFICNIIGVFFLKNILLNLATLAEMRIFWIHRLNTNGLLISPISFYLFKCVCTIFSNPYVVHIISIRQCYTGLFFSLLFISWWCISECRTAREKGPHYLWVLDSHSLWSWVGISVAIGTENDVRSSLLPPVPRFMAACGGFKAGFPLHGP